MPAFILPPLAHALWVPGSDEDVGGPICGVIRVNNNDYDAILSHETRSRAVMLSVRVAVKVRTNPRTVDHLLSRMSHGSQMCWNWSPECGGLLRLDTTARIPSNAENPTLVLPALVQSVGHVLRSGQLRVFLARGQARTCAQPYIPWSD